jgi:hypothetical protein
MSKQSTDQNHRGKHSRFKEPKTLALPNISSEFALIDVKKGRKALAKVVAKGYRVPFTISGYVQPGPNGRDDGVSIEFCADVTSAQFGKPELAGGK